MKFLFVMPTATCFDRKSGAIIPVIMKGVSHKV